MADLTDGNDGETGAASAAPTDRAAQSRGHESGESGSDRPGDVDFWREVAWRAAAKGVEAARGEIGRLYAAEGRQPPVPKILIRFTNASGASGEG